MTEEEKKAIDILNNVVADEVVGTYCLEIQKTTNCAENCKDDDCFIIKAIDIVLNLINRQQKENEEMREELQMYVDTNLMKEKLEREIEKLKGIHKEFLKLHQELKAEDTFLSADNIIKAIRKNYIKKDKIKQKIKEIENVETDKISREEYNRIEFAIEILLELLEE